MSEARDSVSKFEYHKIEIDNAVCRRRFHIAFEEGQPPVPKVSLDCPHCGLRLWEADNHPPAILLREENLVRSPDGSVPLLTECPFVEKTSAASQIPVSK